MALQRRQHLAPVVLLAAVVILRGAPLGAALAANWAGIMLVRLPPCDPNWFVCRADPHFYPPMAWEKNQSSLELVRSVLSETVNLAPDNASTVRRLAETEFALGGQAQAAADLPALPLQSPALSIGGFAPAVPSRLMMPEQYEYYLVLARQQAAKGQWEETVWAYRWALALGPEYLTPADHLDYFAALAQWHAGRVAQGDDVARQAYLAGKYFARADDWQAAGSWLEAARQTPDWGQLSADDQAMTWTYTGLVREQSGDLQAARAAYETAAGISLALAEPRLQLLALLRRLPDLEGAGRLAAGLAQQGPGYRLGQFGQGLASAEPITLPDGWTLAGYDVDVESLETGGPLELWLWWQAPAGARPSQADGWLEAGAYWLDLQTVINLAPNSGFEWPGPTEGLPAGFLNRFDTDKSGRLSEIESAAGSSASRVLQLKPGGNAGILGIKSFPVWVEPAGQYLMAGWLKSGERGTASLGRECFTFGDVNYSVAQSRMGNPPSTPNINALTPDRAAAGLWIHMARLSRPLADRPADQCHLYLEQHAGLGEFDQILFARLTVP